MTARDPELKKELDATLQTRKELGVEYESELVDSFLEKVEQKLDGTLDKQVRRRLAEHQMSTARGPQQRPGGGPGVDSFGERFGFATVSLVLAIPLSAIGTANAGLAGLLVTWAGIVGVNVVNAAGYVPWFRQRFGKADDNWS
ncbi:hypothetical protein AB0I22_31660 [Streptomyces sp. NPDC050610]|uniref:hypothetical protein n=1 Tax=Streptomyces sp. NPDC050610 TaxID=3157097 RepID=UPI0034334746